MLFSNGRIPRSQLPTQELLVEQGQPLECWQQMQKPGFLKGCIMSAPRARDGAGLCGGCAYIRGARAHPGKVLLCRHARIILRESVPATYRVLKILTGALTVKSGSASSEPWQRKSWGTCPAQVAPYSFCLLAGSSQVPLPHMAPFLCPQWGEGDWMLGSARSVCHSVASD